MRVCIGVVAHTSRKTMAEQLAEQVSAATVAVDDGRLGCRGNHLQVWKYLAAHDSDWTVVLEDDAVPVDDFRHQLHQALTHTPCPVTSLYLGTGRPPHWQTRIRDAVAKAHANDASYIVTTHLLHAVAAAVKTPLIPHMLAHIEAKQYLPIDEAISQWAKRAGHSIAYTMPSICQHHDGPTLVKHRDGSPRNKPRKAWTVGVRTTWTAQAVTM